MFCEGNFAEIDGKTANGLVRQSERYEVTSVIVDFAGRGALVIEQEHPGRNPLGVEAISDRIAAKCGQQNIT